MRKLNLCKDQRVYLIGFCCLHTLQLTLSNAISNVIGLGKLEGRNAMQLIHSIYDLQKTMEIGLWRKEYSKAANEVGQGSVKFNKMAAPILTRWWTVGEAASDLLEHFPIFMKLCENVRNAHTSDSAKNRIASSILSLSRVPVILSDVNLISCFHDAFLNTHFSWMQKGDKLVGNTPGFLGRHMFSRFYLMQLQGEYLLTR